MPHFIGLMPRVLLRSPDPSLNGPCHGEDMPIGADEPGAVPDRPERRKCRPDKFVNLVASAQTAQKQHSGSRDARVIALAEQRESRLYGCLTIAAREVHRG